MPISRKKACARCRQSKLRCDLETPCSHCTKKRLRCIYNGRDADPYQMLSMSRDTTGGRFPATDMSDTATAIAEASSVSDLGGPGGIPLEWDALGRHEHALLLETPKSFGIETVELQRLLRHNMFPEQVDFTLLPTDAGSLSPPHNNTVDVLQPMSSSEGAWSPPPSLRHDSPVISIPKITDQRAMQRRFYLPDCALTSVVLGQLTGYPKMMLDGDTLPPFIHPPCYSDEELATECRLAGKHRCLPQILAICSSLVEMFDSRTPANEDFVWKTIYAEGARLCKSLHKFDREEQLAATQAMTIYILLQAGDFKSVMKNDVSTLLMQAMECIFWMSNKHTWRLDIPRERPRRCDWVFVESIRRIFVIFCVFDLLFEGMRTPDGYSCDSNGNAFGVNALPCNRYIWEARTTRSWMMHYDRFLSTRESDETLTGDHLVESRLSGSTSTLSAARAPKRDVLRWCEGLDSLGTVVWMVLPLHIHRREQNRLNEQ